MQFKNIYKLMTDFMRAYKSLGKFRDYLPKKDDKAIANNPGQEIKDASEKLAQVSKFAIFGKLGGFRPDKSNRLQSWYAGNFVGLKGEEVPVCKSNGIEMEPLLQIKMGELAYVPAPLKQYSILTYG